MKQLTLAASLLLLFQCVPAVLAQPVEKTATVEDQIHQQLQKYVTAFNAGNVADISSLWLESGVYTDHATGTSTSGREQIVAELKEFFSAHAGAKLTGTAHEIKPLGESVVKATGSTQLIYADGAEEATSFVALFVKQGEQWLLESITETSRPLVGPQEVLQSLAWLIGEWRDENDSHEVKTFCNWSRSGTFLIRSFSVNDGETLSEGTEVIGWDPQYRQIRSWAFFSDGSFGSGFWSRNGDTWVVKSVHTLADGTIAEALRVVSEITENSLKVQLTSHSINGELQPSREPVTVRRVKASETPVQEGAGVE